MLRKIEFTYTDGQINPECHVVVQVPLFDGAGNPVARAETHRAAVDVATINLTADPHLRLTDADKATVRKAIAEAKRGRTIWAPPETV